jgi:fructose-1,6-bisphosphatase I
MATTQAILSANLAVAPAAVSNCENSSRNASSTKLSGSSLHGSVAGLGAGKLIVSLRKSCTAARAAVSVGAEPVAPKQQQQKSQYDITTLTTWLLKKEQTGSIDGELTIVLSSIALACKQIASLVQRAGISNLTGLQGASNIQGEDQKKLDVISNEVSSSNHAFSSTTQFSQAREVFSPKNGQWAKYEFSCCNSMAETLRFFLCNDVNGRCSLAACVPAGGQA